MNRTLLVLLLALLALAGCASTAPSEPDWQDGERAAAQLLDEYRRVLALPADAQQREYQIAMAALDQNANSMQRLRVALLMTLPRAPWRDDTRLLQLLDESAAGTREDEAALRDLALLVQKLVLERLQLMREELRKAGEAQHRLQNLLAERQRQLNDERRRSVELEQKVDALRSIDRDILRRQNKR